MKNNLEIILYSYKGKYLKEILDQLQGYSSHVVLLDQHPLDRKDLFFKTVKQYIHIFWDKQNSPCNYKKNFIDKVESDYILLLSDNVFLSSEAINEMISFIETNNCVISGFGSNKIEQKDLFSIKQIRDFSNSYSLTNFISRDFIIAKTDSLKKIQYPYFLKYNGEEELLSLLFFINNLNIYSAPSNFGNVIGKRTIEDLYVPFSLDHNYNEVINIFNGKNSSYIQQNINKDIIRDFSIFHNFDFESLKPLPYINNDVLYDQYQLNFFGVNGRKFTETTRAIH